jgi:hypothetical protein
VVRFLEIATIGGIMSDLNRGIMKFRGADTPIAVTLSAVLVLGAIAFLIVWALNSAYAIS